MRRSWIVQSGKEVGFTLVEAAISLAIIGAAVAGIWLAASSVQRSVQLTTLGEQLHQIVDNVRGLYTNQRGMFVDNTQAQVNGAACGAANFNSRLSCLGVYPGDLITGVAGNDAYHAWDQTLAGGSVLVLPRDINYNVIGAAPGPDSFGVQMLNLPEDICTEMVVRHSVPDQKYDLKAVLFYDAGGTLTDDYVTASGPPDWTLGNTRTDQLPINPTQAVNACTGAGAVEFVFSLRGGG